MLELRIKGTDLEKAEANELTDVDVKFVSIVKRGANRIPVKITKSEDDSMLSLNLSEMFRKADGLPGIVAVAVSKDSDLDSAKARIEKAGFTTDDERENSDGSTLFVQPGENLEQDDLEIVQVDESMAVIVKNAALKKTFSDFNFDSTEFKDVMGQEGFFPSLSAAHGVLGATISNIMQKAETAADAKDQVSKAIGDFGKFVDGLVGSIPVTAFKIEAEGDTPANAKKDDTDEDGKSKKADAGEGNDGSDAGDDDKSNAKKADDEDDDPDKKGTKSYSGKVKKKKADDAGDAAGADDDDQSQDNSAQLGQILQGIGQISESVKGLTKTVDDNGKRLDQVAKDASAAMETAKKADETASGITAGDTRDDDVGEGPSKTNGAGPLLDTARMSKAEKEEAGILGETVRR